MGLALHLATSEGEPSEVFTIDPDQSIVTMSGTSLGSPFQEQAPGSLSTKFSGTVHADVTASTIRFPGEGLAQALNSGNWEPRADASAGRDPANYGALAAISFITVKAAARQIQLQVVSSALPLGNGAFPASGLILFFPTNAPSSLAYRPSGMYPPGVKPLIGVATNRATAPATLTTVGQGLVLRAPIETQFVLSLIAANDTTVNLVGTVVATCPLPVPPRFQSVALTNQIVTLRWQGTPGDSYQLRSTADFQTWQTRATNLTSATSNHWWSGPTSNSHEFFRLSR